MSKLEAINKYCEWRRLDVPQYLHNPGQMRMESLKNDHRWREHIKFCINLNGGTLELESRTKESTVLISTINDHDLFIVRNQC